MCVGGRCSPGRSRAQHLRGEGGEQVRPLREFIGSDPRQHQEPLQVPFPEATPQGPGPPFVICFLE